MAALAAITPHTVHEGQSVGLGNLRNAYTKTYFYYSASQGEHD